MRNTPRALCLLCALLLCLATVPAAAEEAQTPDTLNTILSARAVKSYTDEPVSPEDLAAILSAGVKAPSAQNRQPWRFVVVTDSNILQNTLRQPNGALIVVCGLDSQSSGMNVDFDCGLATQNMYLAAHALGLGANILLSPVESLQAMRADLAVPDGYRVVMALSIGHYDADALSAATPRDPLDDIALYAP